MTDGHVATNTANTGKIDIEAWRRRIRSDTFGRYHLAMGDALSKEGETDAVIAAYRRAVQAFDTPGPADIRLVRILERTGRTQEARAAHEAASSRDPRYELHGWSRIGTEALEEYDFPLALEAWSNAVEKSPDDPDARFHLAVARYCHGDVREGDEHFDAIFDRLDEERRRVFSAMALALGQRISNDTTSSLALGEAPIALGLAAARLSPHDPLIAASVILSHVRNWRFDTLRARLDRPGPLQDHAEHPLSSGYRGWMALLCGEWAEAERLCRAGLAYDAPSAIGQRQAFLAGAAAARFAQGDRAGARIELSAALEEAPRALMPGLFLDLFNIVEGLPRTDTLRKLAAETPATLRVLPMTVLGLTHHASGNPREAENVYRAALKEPARAILANGPWTPFLLALSLKAQGAPDAETVMVKDVLPHGVGLDFCTFFLPPKLRNEAESWIAQSTGR